METLLAESLVQRKAYIRTGRVRVEPIRRSSDWLLPESDSAFMNTGAKQEYVVPNSLRTGALFDPLNDLSDAEREQVAKELGFKSAEFLNINKPHKENYWINRPVILDKNGRYLNLSNIGDFIAYKILQCNTEYIAPSWDEKYNKGTFKFALVLEEEESKIKSLKVDTKKEAYMLFGKIDGSIKKMSDFLWIYYLTDKEGKRLPNNPNLEYCKGEIGRIIEEKTGIFLSIMTDSDFDTKVLIQKSINGGLIHRDGMMFTVFGEPSSKNTLEGLIGYLKDERNNNIRLSLIGRLENAESNPGGIIPQPEKKIDPGVSEGAKTANDEILKRIEQMEKISKETIESNNILSEKNTLLSNENEELKKQIELLQVSKPTVKKLQHKRGPKGNKSKKEIKLEGPTENTDSNNEGLKDSTEIKE